MSTPEARLLATDLNKAAKKTSIRLSRDLGTPTGVLRWRATDWVQLSYCCAVIVRVETAL